MQNWNIRVLGTGSTGNCILINDELALDCGIIDFRKQFASNVDLSLRFNLQSKLKTILITHGHIDHIQGLNFLPNDFINLKSIVFNKDYITQANNLNITTKDLNTLKKVYQNYTNVPSNLSILKTFDVKHDLLDDGYIFKYDNKLVCYANDIGDVDSVVIGYNYNQFTNQYTFYTVKEILDNPNLIYSKFDMYFIECNHDADIIRNKLKDKSLIKSKRKYYTRALQVHLSTVDCNLILSLIQNAYVLLLHRSIENLPLSQSNYFFLNENNKHWLKVAINPNEWNEYDVQTKNNLHLCINWDIKWNN